MSKQELLDELLACLPRLEQCKREAKAGSPEYWQNDGASIFISNLLAEYGMLSYEMGKVYQFPKSGT